MGLDLKGQAGILRKLDRLAQQGPNAIAGSLFRQGEKIMGRSKEEFVPVDLGVLKASGHVQLPEINGDEITVVMGYGGPAEAYALVQHERLDFNHPNGGGPKYLERPLMEAKQTLLHDIAKDLDLEGLVR
jgi:hypothetical protein